MSKIRIIYLYLVCLITLFMAVGGFISGINYISQYFFPTSYSYYSTSYYDVNYTEYNYKYQQIQEEKERERQRENEKIRNVKSAITAFALVVVSAPIFVYHWKKIESERKELEV